MAEKLTPRERIAILSKRLINFRKGAGNYSVHSRPAAIKACQAALNDAQGDYRKEGA